MYEMNPVLSRTWMKNSVKDSVTSLRLSLNARYPLYAEKQQKNLLRKSFLRRKFTG